MAALGVETKKSYFVTLYLASLYTRGKFGISSVICLLLRVFIVHALARMDEDLDFDNVHNQIQPYLFEPLASGHDSSDDNSRESDSAFEHGDYDVNQERIGQVD